MNTVSKEIVCCFHVYTMHSSSIRMKILGMENLRLSPRLQSSDRAGILMQALRPLSNASGMQASHSLALMLLSKEQRQYGEPVHTIRLSEWNLPLVEDQSFILYCLLSTQIMSIELITSL